MPSLQRPVDEWGTADALEALLARPAWQREAACRGKTDIMYPHHSRPAPEAVSLCDACPVRDVCLETALADNEQEGVWGGTTEKERRRMQRDRQRNLNCCVNGHSNEERSPITGRCLTCQGIRNRRWKDRP